MPWQMLRHRLLILIGPLVCALVATAAVGVWLLEGTLDNIDYVNQTVMGTWEQANDFVIALRDVRRQLESGHEGQIEQMNASMDSARQIWAQIGRSPIARQPPIQAEVQRVNSLMPAFERQIAELARPGARLETARVKAAMDAANALDAVAGGMHNLVRSQAHVEHQELSSRFRYQLLVIAAVSIAVINLIILVYLKVAGMILRPVDALVNAARELGRERFETRVNLQGADEFDQLARAYNQMAGQLQAAEQRRLEVLGQVAVALNHELNNAISIIELQLRLARRRTGDRGLEQNLQQIAESLGRITRVVASLRQARRIVLTDYVGGTKMLDLEKSAQMPDLPMAAKPNGSAQLQS